MKTFTMELHTGLVEFVLIENEDGSQLTMFKSIYDAQLAAQSTPIVTEDE